MKLFWVLYIGVLIFILLFGLVSYILNGLGFYALAKRRGIPHPGLAWVPIGGGRWILGSLSDQYAFLTRGVSQYRRHILMWLDIATNALYSWYLALTVPVLLRGDAGMALFNAMGLYWLATAVGLAMVVYLYMALYGVYRSCDPKNATLFLVLSIVVNVTLPFFVFFSRKKDLGMPPPPGEPGAGPAAEGSQGA